MTDAHGGYGGHHEQERRLQGASHTGGVGNNAAGPMYGAGGELSGALELGALKMGGPGWSVTQRREAAVHLAGKIIEAQIGLKDVKAPHTIAIEAW